MAEITGTDNPLGKLYIYHSKAQVIRIYEMLSKLNGFICISKTIIPRVPGILWIDKLLHKGTKLRTSDRQSEGSGADSCAGWHRLRAWP